MTRGRKKRTLNKDMAHARRAVDKIKSGKLSLVQPQHQISHKEPSRKLKNLINECASQFSKLEDTLEKAKTLGLQEGFTSIEVGDMIRSQMLDAGYHRSTVARILPSEMKHMEKARSKFGSILLPKAVEEELTRKDFDNTIKEEVEQPASQYMDSSQQIQEVQQQITRSIEEVTDINQFEMSNRHLYKPEFLIKVGNELIRLGKEKLGQTKKYQPTPDEIKQREDKVLSLVKEGVTRISDLVKQSGVSESACRRYLEKAGYKVFAGMIDLGAD